MSELGNFADLANVRVGDVEPPKAIPPGHYKAIFTGLMKPHKAKSGNQAMRFPFKLIEAGDDVDPELLEAAGGLPDKEFSLDFWMSPDARYRFTDFGKAMGHSDDLNLIELAEALGTGGEPFMIECSLQDNEKDPSKPYTRFDNPTPAV
jgi:hypothetical protein